MDYESRPKEEQVVFSKKTKKNSGTGLAVIAISLCVALFIALISSVMYFSARNRELNENYQTLLQQFENKSAPSGKENITDNRFDSDTPSVSGEPTISDREPVSDIVSKDELNQAEGIIDENSYALSTVVAAVRPSVVCVFVTVPSQTVDYGYAQYQTQAATSSGSGIIWSQDGYIITNQHVVEHAQQYDSAYITILLDDGTELDATLIAADKQTDLALLKVESDKMLPAINIGTSSNLLVGETAIAIGNPLGIKYANSVTVGIVSGLDRQVTGENGVSTMIQTDAAVNPGNSGGALVDASGKLIGVVSAKISSTEVEGIGFAIPIDHALTILNSLKEYGYVKGRPATGIASGTEITLSMSRRYRLPQGLYITEITENSAAEEAGIQKYDIILTVEGQNITTLNQIEAIKKEHQVGDSLSITFYRSGTVYETTLILTEDKG